MSYNLKKVIRMLTLGFIGKGIKMYTYTQEQKHLLSYTQNVTFCLIMFLQCHSLHLYVSTMPLHL